MRGFNGGCSPPRLSDREGRDWQQPSELTAGCQSLEKSEGRRALGHWVGGSGGGAEAPPPASSGSWGHVVNLEESAGRRMVFQALREQSGMSPPGIPGSVAAQAVDNPSSPSRSASRMGVSQSGQLPPKPSPLLNVWHSGQRRSPTYISPQVPHS